MTSWSRTSPSAVPSSVPDKQNALVQKLVAPHIESFDYLFEEGLKLAVESIPPMKIDVPNQPSITLWIEDAKIGKPVVKGSNGQMDKLYPAECRQRGVTYSAPFSVTLGQSTGESSSAQHIQRETGDVPIMVRSKHCHLRGMSTKELVEKKEEAGEMGGYFICNGNERCVRLLQMPRRHHIMAVQRGSYTKRGNLYSDKAVTMRCVRRDQSAVTLTLHYLVDGNATVRFGIGKQEFLVPAILLLKALYDVTDKEIYERVMRGDHKNTYLSARMELILRESKRFQVYTREEALVYLGSHFRSVMPYLSDDMTDMQVGSRLLENFVFVHIGSGDKARAQKAELLMLMLRKLYAFAKGDICQDNPDSVMNHELLLPGHLYLMILKEKLQEMLLSIKQGILKECRAKVGARPGKVLVNASDPVFIKKVWERTMSIGRAMMYFLNTGNLKTSSGLDLMQLAGYTVVAEKLNYYRYFSHFRSVHRGQFFTTMKTTAVRKLLPDSWGFMCPVHTPDGSPCGLLNHLAVECKIITSPPSKAKTIENQEIKLARYLCNLGMIASNGYSDGALVLPYDYLPIMLNGKVLGGASQRVCKSIAKNIRTIKVSEDDKLKLEYGVDTTLEVCLITKVEAGPFPGLFLSADAARLSRPVKQLDTGKVEMIGPMEQVFMDIACTSKDVRKATTHIEIDPTNMLSLVASLTPFSDYNQSPRNMYQCQMAKQTMGTPCHSIAHRTDNKMYRIQSPQAPLVQNRRLKEFELDEYPLGTNAVVAVISYTGYDMEDAMILNRSSYNRGFGHASVYKQLMVDISPASKGMNTSYFFSNVKSTDGNGDVTLFTDALDKDGLPPIGKVVEFGDYIACYVNESTGDAEYVKHKESEPAIIDQINVLSVDSGSSNRMQKVGIKLRFCRNPVVGDKFSSRHGQKGVMSILWPQENMPFTESGMSPDIIINPHAFPSRMTIGMLVESMAAKSGSIHGKYQDSTPFQFSEEDRVIDHFGKELRQAGYNYMGSEPLYSGLSGTIMQADIYIGIVYYQRLRHMVSDKSQVRATGPTNSLTRQPVKGRKKRGGIRFGEMERDSLLSHGCAFLLQDRLMNCSDKHVAVVCTQCGSLLSTMTQRATVESAGQAEIAAYIRARDHWICVSCNSGTFCEAVAMPYVFRYLVNELAAMNIKLKLTVKSC